MPSLFSILILITITMATVCSCDRPVVDLPPTPQLTEIHVSCAKNSIPQMVNFPCAAVGLYSDGTNQIITNQVQWRSSNPTVLDSTQTIFPGWMLGISPGAGSVIATSGVIQGSFNMTITGATPVSLVVTPANQTLKAGTQQQFASVCIFSDSSFFDVTQSANWSSSNSGIANVNTAFSDIGKVTAMSVGTTQITATFDGIQGLTPITVLNKDLIAIQIGPTAATVIQGLSTSFTATGINSDLSTEDVTANALWSVTNASVASISNSVGSTGQLTALQTGSTTVVVNYGGFSDTANVMIINPTLNSITLTPANSSLALGLSRQFVATGHYSDGSSADLSQYATWSSSNPGIASASNIVGSIGNITGTGLGTVVISATMSGITGSTNLTITPALLASVALTPSTPSIPLGLTQALIATGTYTDGSTADLTTTATWASSAPSIASVSNVGGSQGLVNSIAIGHTNISASVGTVVGQTSVTVTSPALTSIAVTPANSSVAKGLTLQYVATGYYSDGSSADISSSVVWASLNSTVATVSNASGNKGQATGTGVGTTTLSATMNGVTGNTNITVTPALLVSIALTPSTPSIPLGLTQALIATGTYTDGSTADLTTTATWVSASISIATVGITGLVSSVAIGHANISASVGSIVGQTSVTVTAPALTSIAVTPVNNSIAKGLTLQYVATGHYSDGTSADISTSVAWASLDPTIATISNASGSRGRATGTGVGTTTISATLGSINGTTPIQVTPAVLLSIAVTPANTTIIALQSVQFTAMGTYTDGTVDLTTSVTWASSNVLTATISNTAGTQGKATGVGGLGSTTITATLGGISGSTQLNGIL